jgi:hypothetical protein
MAVVVVQTMLAEVAVGTVLLLVMYHQLPVRKQLAELLAQVVQVEMVELALVELAQAGTQL